MKKSIAITRTMKLFLSKKVLSYVNIVIFTALLTTVLHGCVTMQPLTTGIVDEVALLSTTANFMQQSGINAYAGICRKQFIGEANEINEIMINYVDTLRDGVVFNLRTQLGCKVLYGADLQAMPQYNTLRKSFENVDALHKEDENFPEVYISSGDANFVISNVKTGVLEGGRVVNLNKNEMKETVKNICKELNVKYIAFANFNFYAWKSDVISRPATYIIYYLDIYNQEGDRIAGVFTNTETKGIKKEDITDSYVSMVRTFPFGSTKINK